EAIRDCTEAQSINPEAVDALTVHASALCVQQNPEGAIVVLETAKNHKLTPTTQHAVDTTTGIAELMRGNLDAAMDNLSKAEKSRRDPNVLTFMAIVHLRKGDCETARQILDEAIVLDGCDVEARWVRWKVLERLGHQELAEADRLIVERRNYQPFLEI